MSASRWRRALPDPPARRYTVFGGTSSWSEWRGAWLDLLGRAGPGVVEGFEEAAASSCGVRHAVAFGAGRMSLYALIGALGMRAGDEVVLPGFTCAVVPNAFVYRGVRPVYADISPATFNVDPAAVEACITPRTRAVYMQHTFGTTCDVAALRAIAGRHGLALIEDAAHSLGASHDGRRHGSLGTAGFVSTDSTKVVNTQLGGFATTDDEAIARSLRAARDGAGVLSAAQQRRALFGFLAEFALRHPDVLWLGRPMLGALRRAGLTFAWSDERSDAIPAAYPFPARMSEPLARIGMSQLAGLEANLAHRRQIARWLEDRIGWNAGRLHGAFEDQAWLRYSFLVRDREEFVARFGERIDLGIWFPEVIFGRGTDTEAVGYREGLCPNAERVSRHIVNLLTHPRIPLGLYERSWERHGPWLQANLLRP